MPALDMRWPLAVLVGSLGAVAACGGQEEPPEPADVLIIYDSGIPSRSISEMKPGDEYVMAGPTPAATNCETIANLLASAFESRDLVVRVIPAAEIVSQEEVLRSRLVILGSPTRFWNVSWKIKKLLDEVFGGIYVSRKKQFAKQRVAAFAMAEIEPSAEAALATIRAVARDCGGKLDHTLVVLTNHSQSEVRRRIRAFADQLAPPPRGGQEAWK